jgi:hypothetical protein
MSTERPFPARHYPLSLHYRRRFGCKVYKVSVSVAQSCPNREGLRGMQVCVFCDEWGAAAYPEHAGRSLAEQFRQNRERIQARYKADKFLVYLQAYTNTFARVSRLADWLEEALALPDVVGVVLGTRPDCLPERMLRLLAEAGRRSYVSLELGVQTLDDAQLAFLSRGHDQACSLRALERLRAHPEIETCVHLMFGVPGETDDQLRETAALLSAAGVRGVKLHNLHVLRNTPLQALYERGAFAPVSLPAYAHKVAVFLEHLSPRIAVHRLNAVASRWEEVVAPDWARQKLAPTQAILAHLARVDAWQGKHYPGSATPGTLEPRGTGPLEGRAAEGAKERDGIDPTVDLRDPGHPGLHPLQADDRAVLPARGRP